MYAEEWCLSGDGHFYDLGLYAGEQGQGASVGWGQAFTSAATGWGSPAHSVDPSSPFCSDPGSGFSRACRVSACHSCTRSVGVFPAWGNQEEIWSLLRSLSQKGASPIPVASSWEQLAMSEASFSYDNLGVGGTSGILSRGQDAAQTSYNAQDSSTMENFHFQM